MEPDVSRDANPETPLRHSRDLREDTHRHLQETRDALHQLLPLLWTQGAVEESGGGGSVTKWNSSTLEKPRVPPRPPTAPVAFLSHSDQAPGAAGIRCFFGHDESPEFPSYETNNTVQMELLEA